MFPSLRSALRLPVQVGRGFSSSLAPPGALGEKEAQLVRLMLPDDANPTGNVHGGTLLKLIEQVGWVVASRHANSGPRKGLLGVTARIEQMSFHEPAYIGEVVTLKAKLAYTSPRSMMVVVKATAENSMAQTSRHTNTAVLWYVGLDAKDPSLRQVAEIPAFVPSNQEEEQLFATGAALYHQRKKFELESTVKLAESKEAIANSALLDPSNYPKLPGARSPQYSKTELAHLLLPSDCTQAGFGQGGVIMKLMDTATALTAIRHCSTSVVTLSLEAMNFKNPSYNGNLIVVSSKLNFVSQKSMEVGVTVEAEDLGTGQRKVTNTSFFKFVSMGKDLKTLPVRPMALETREDVQHFLDGKKRYENKGSKKNQ